MFELLSESGCVLLVGEGNFSFSCSLLKRYESFDAKRLLATSYESRDLCIEKYGRTEVSENLMILKAKGVSVLHQVDATRLSEIECGESKFDKIIFQFPHTGRKASIKQNRDLLRKFFHSARESLHHSGSVIITLCVGQGGTPSDIVQREYCNSWQIVEMAAESDFILTEVKLFDSSKFPGYTSTGRRNHGSSFNTTRAMSHRFISAEILPSLTLDWKCLTEPAFEDCFPSAIQKRLQLLIEKPETMPCCWISKEISERMGYKEHSTALEIEAMDIYGWMRAPFQKAFSKMSSFLDDRLHSLLQGSVKNGQTNVLFHGPSLHPTKLEDGSLHTLFQHNMLLISDLPFEQLVLELTSVLAKYCDCKFKLVPRKSVCDKQQVYKEIDYIVRCSGTCVYGIRGNSEEGFSVGHEVYVSAHSSISILLVNVADLIELLIPSLSEHRILWSLNDFTRMEAIQALKKKTCYIPRSLHPPMYTHDFSFWLENTDSDKLAFSEENLIMVIFLTADDALFSLNLVDEYKTIRKKSYCYRVTYHCHDFVLSRQNCLRLQENVRKNISALINVTIR